MKQKNIILMVVAVGCGLVAAVLTSQMSAKPRDEVEVVVAAKDIPVGTMIHRDDLKTLIKIVKKPKEAVLPTSVFNPEDLVDKRVTRAVRADETFNSQELSKGGIITLPEGHNMVTLQVGAANAAAGFIGPGSRANVLATVQLGNRTEAFTLLCNMLVVAVDAQTQFPKEGGAFPSLSTVSFAVKEKEALLLSLAKRRGCSLELMLRNPTGADPKESDEKYREELVDKNLKKLSDEKEKALVSPAETGSGNGEVSRPNETLKPVDPTTPMGSPMTPPSTPADVKPADTVKVRVAKGNIAPNTEITTDLIDKDFEEKELPRGLAGEAVTDLYQHRGKVLKNGVTKGFWVTKDMIDFYQSSKDPGEAGPKPPEAQPQTNPVRPAPTAKRKFHDVTMHTGSGVIVHRYEEVAPGEWKKIAELSPEQAARTMTEQPKPAPTADADKKID